MSKFRLILLALLAIAASACGAEGTKTVGGYQDPEAKLDDPVSYFGVQPCVCYEYQSTDPKEPRTLGIAVETLKDLYDPGTPHSWLVYRLSGVEQRRYILDATDHDLLVSHVFITNAAADEYQDDEWRFAPPMSLVHWPLDIGSTWDQDTTASLFHEGLVDESYPETAIHSEILTTEAVPVSASRDGNVTVEEFQAYPLDYFDTPWSEDKRWFVPDVGIVKLELTLASQDGKKNTWILKNIRQLDASCPDVQVTDCGT